VISLLPSPLLPPIAGAISTRVRIIATGMHIPHEGPARLASYRWAGTRIIDGAALDGEAPGMRPSSARSYARNRTTFTLPKRCPPEGIRPCSTTG
jgi:hypothetical protein